MSAGRLIAVVGPSGVGKDSLMRGMAASDSGVQLVRRVITRAADLGGEDYDAVSPDFFLQAAANGAFCVHWEAHGLHYGIPAQVLTDVRSGAQCLANFSRSALREATALFPRLLVLNVTASPETLSRRLTDRGRETTSEIARRLDRSASPLPKGLDVVEIRNDGALEQTIAAALAALETTKVRC